RGQGQQRRRVEAAGVPVRPAPPVEPGHVEAGGGGGGRRGGGGTPPPPPAGGGGPPPTGRGTPRGGRTAPRAGQGPPQHAVTSPPVRKEIRRGHRWAKSLAGLTTLAAMLVARVARHSASMATTTAALSWNLPRRTTGSQMALP